MCGRVLGRHPDLVLDEPARRRLGPRGRGVGLLGRPGRPGLVGLAHVASAYLDGDRCAGWQLGPPRERTEAGEELGVVNLRDQFSLGNEARGQPDDRPGVARSQEDSAAGLGQQREDLAVVELRQRGALCPLVADLVELPIGAGADQQAIVGPGEREDQGPGPEDLAGNAVGVDPVDRVVPRGDRLGRGGARRGRPGRGGLRRGRRGRRLRRRADRSRMVHVRPRRGISWQREGLGTGMLPLGRPLARASAGGRAPPPPPASAAVPA